MKIAFETARDLRKRSTIAEDAFWQIVRNRRFLNLKFKRQCPIEFEYDGAKRFFIADFYCHSDKLVVEIDGGIHESQKEYDNIRDEVMKILGLKVIRFKNLEVLKNVEDVLKKLSVILHLQRES